MTDFHPYVVDVCSNETNFSPSLADFTHISLKYYIHLIIQLAYFPSMHSTRHVDLDSFNIDPDPQDWSNMDQDPNPSVIIYTGI